MSKEVLHIQFQDMPHFDIIKATSAEELRYLFQLCQDTHSGGDSALIRKLNDSKGKLAKINNLTKRKTKTFKISKAAVRGSSSPRWFSAVV